jgi:hypothetical protein
MASSVNFIKKFSKIAGFSLWFNIKKLKGYQSHYRLRKRESIYDF